MKSLLRKNTEQILSEVVSEYGFKKKGFYYIRTSSGEAFDTLLFQINSYGLKGHLFVEADAGIGHTTINKILSVLFDSSLYRVSPLLEVNSGNLLPQKAWLEWDFFNEADIDKIQKDIQNHLVKYVIPFYEKLHDYESMVKALSDATIPSSNRLAYYAAILYYQGNKNLAVSFLETRLNAKKRVNESDIAFLSNLKDAPEDYHDLFK